MNNEDVPKPYSVGNLSRDYLAKRLCAAEAVMRKQEEVAMYSTSASNSHSACDEYNSAVQAFIALRAAYIDSTRESK